jgi:hypothetical protein
MPPLVEMPAVPAAGPAPAVAAAPPPPTLPDAPAWPAVGADVEPAIPVLPGDVSSLQPAVKTHKDPAARPMEKTRMMKSFR